jgi:hypothetical protein
MQEPGRELEAPCYKIPPLQYFYFFIAGSMQEVTFTEGRANASSWASQRPIHAPSSAFGENSPAGGWAAIDGANQVVFYQFNSSILVTRFTIGEFHGQGDNVK